VLTVAASDLGMFSAIAIDPIWKRDSQFWR
jgi:hypothetical protein